MLRYTGEGERTDKTQRHDSLDTPTLYPWKVWVRGFLEGRGLWTITDCARADRARQAAWMTMAYEGGPGVI